MENNDVFFTMKGYFLHEPSDLTSAAEDYLEMICRIEQSGESATVSALASKLNVKPSSASKMVSQLAHNGYLDAEKYGDIRTTEKGKAAGNYLLCRHSIIHEFLCALNRTDSELEETEKIEHFLRRETVENLERLTKMIAD